MILFYCFLTVLCLYITFIFAPAIVAYKTVFCRKDGKPFTDRDLSNTYLAPYEKRIADDFSFFNNYEKERISISANDGVNLVGYYYSGGNKRLAICVHGYNSTPLNCFASSGRYLLSIGYDVLMINQRAHGESGGKHSTLGLTEQYDVLAWIDRADNLDNIDEIIVSGVSMGCASVAYASDKIKNPKVKALILDCGFSSPYSQVKSDCQKRHLPYKLLMPIIRCCAKLFLKIDILQSVSASLEHAAIPALFIHGSKDTTVNISETEEHYRIYNARKELYIAENGNHANAFIAGGEEAEAAISSFLMSI